MTTQLNNSQNVCQIDNPVKNSQNVCQIDNPVK